MQNAERDEIMALVSRNIGARLNESRLRQWEVLDLPAFPSDASVQNSVSIGGQNPPQRSQQCESSPDALSDERLDEIATRIALVPWNDGIGYSKDCITYYAFHRSDEQDRALIDALSKMKTDIPDLIAEIRRLRAENRLLHLSRGSESVVGQD